MNKVNKSLWGIFFIALGLIIGLNALEITDIDIFFDGWWTLFIIIPCFIDLFKSGNKIGNIIGLAFGIALLLVSRDIISFGIIMKLIFPFILVVIGLSILFNETIKSEITSKLKSRNQGDLEEIVATFAEQKVNKDDEQFKGANVDAIFGSVTLDLRGASIDKEATIKASAIFGGINILVPNDVNVKIKSTPIFGGVNNKCANHKDNKKTIYIDAFALFGGVDIK